MEDAEFHKKMIKLTKAFQVEEKKIRREYALSRNNLNTGDIIMDHQGFLEIDYIAVTEKGRAERMPECAYRGFSLTKKMTRRKDGAKRWIYQRNIEEVVSNKV